jgi:hypothetical protein
MSLEPLMSTSRIHSEAPHIQGGSKFEGKASYLEFAPQPCICFE